MIRPDYGGWTLIVSWMTREEAWISTLRRARPSWMRLSQNLYLHSSCLITWKFWRFFSVVTFVYFCNITFFGTI